MKDIEGFEGKYAVTKDGRVWSYGKEMGHHTGFFLKPHLTYKGYHTFRLYNQALRRGIKDITGHRLVAQTFIENPKNVSDVNHKNGIKTDNRIENLEWCTSLENRHHAVVMGLQVHGEKQRSAKLTEGDVREIRRLCANGVLHRIIGAQFGVNESHVSHIVLRRYWKHI